MTPDEINDFEQRAEERDLDSGEVQILLREIKRQRAIIDEAAAIMDESDEQEHGGRTEHYEALVPAWRQVREVLGT